MKKNTKTPPAFSTSGKNILEPAIKSQSIGAILSSHLPYRTLYNLNPQYQRNFTWAKDKQLKLLDAMLKGISINAIHLCKDNNSGNFNVVDGKQRLTTIFEFYEGKIMVPIQLENGNVECLNYHQITQRVNQGTPNFDKVCWEFYTRFQDYNLQINIYSNLTIEQQIMLFRYINQSDKLTNDEIIYCPNYKTKFLMNSIYDEFFKNKDIEKLFTESVKKDKNYVGSRFVHQLLIFLCGYRLDDESNVREIIMNKIIKSAEDIEKRLGELGYSENILMFSIEDIKNIIGEDNFFKLKKIIEIIESVLMFKGITQEGEVNNIYFEKNMTKGKMNFVSDFFLFLLIKKVNSNYAKQNRGLFAKSLIDYINIKQEKKMLSSGTKHKETLELRIKSIYECCIKNNLSFENGKPFTQKEKNKEYLNAPLFSPFSGELLTKDNIQIDHLQSKNFVEDATPIALDKHTNNFKSDMTPEMAKQITQLNDEKNKKSILSKEPVSEPDDVKTSN